MSYTAQYQKFKDILKQSHHYITRPRTVLFNMLLESDSPLSLNRIHSQARGEMSRASTYRTLETLEKLGIVRRVAIARADKYELSDAFNRHHHHLTCDSCGRVITIKLGENMERAIEGFGNKHGFKITSHEVELRGLCRYCQ